ncbi:MAG: hypothetical protein II626_02545 [Prevotella sp.]|nr:hypothetical protein [Prevotella sp.]
MYKIISIETEALKKVMNEGKKLSGVIMFDEAIGLPVFKPFNGRRRKSDRVVKVLEHGWLKESAKRYKVYESIPKELGVRTVCKVLNREVFEVHEALEKVVKE